MMLSARQVAPGDLQEFLMAEAATSRASGVLGSLTTISMKNSEGTLD
jgi:hypothetical protein